MSVNHKTFNIAMSEVIKINCRQRQKLFFINKITSGSQNTEVNLLKNQQNISKKVTNWCVFLRTFPK